jgi:hypothetical protein
MYPFDYHQVKNIDEQRRRRSLARFVKSRLVESSAPESSVAEVIEMTFPEECVHEQLGA